MTIHFFTKGGMRVASSRQRAFILAVKLAASGIPTLVHHPLRSCDLLAAMPGDIIYLQRTIYDIRFIAAAVLFAACRRNPIIFDFDDACYLHSPFRVRVLMRIANTVVVGSHALEDWTRQFHAHVVRIPTLVDPDDYVPSSAILAMPHPRLVLGWIGLGPDHLPDLALLLPVMRILADRHIPVSLMIVGTLADPRIPALFASARIPTEFVPDLDWADPSAVRDALSSFDIGLAPLCDTLWNRGKGAFKIVQYMASGIPTVASPVGENCHTVRDGVTGFLADAPEHFADAICRLAASPHLRHSFGEAGQRAVRDHFSYDPHLPRFSGLFRSFFPDRGHKDDCCEYQREKSAYDAGNDRSREA